MSGGIWGGGRALGRAVDTDGVYISGSYTGAGYGMINYKLNRYGDIR